MPAGVPFHSPLLYNQQQLQQILANLEKIVFLKVSSQAQQVVVRHVLCVMVDLRYIWIRSIGLPGYNSSMHSANLK